MTIKTEEWSMKISMQTYKLYLYDHNRMRKYGACVNKV